MALPDAPDVVHRRVGDVSNTIWTVPGKKFQLFVAVNQFGLIYPSEERQQWLLMEVRDQVLANQQDPRHRDILRNASGDYELSKRTTPDLSKTQDRILVDRALRIAVPQSAPTTLPARELETIVEPHGIYHVYLFVIRGNAIHVGISSSEDSPSARKQAKEFLQLMMASLSPLAPGRVPDDS